MRTQTMLLAILTLGSTISSAQVIDMHMHSYTEKDFWVGKPRMAKILDSTR